VSAGSPAALRSSRTRRPLRVLIGAFGDPGHAFPAIALAGELHRRGHEVAVETWQRWREHVEREGMSFHAAPEYQVFPTRERPLKPYEAVLRSVRETRALVRDLCPDVVVSDILTLAPALAAELEERPWATLVPHIYPLPIPGLPPYGLGVMPPRRPLARAVWGALSHLTDSGLQRGRRELNETRRRVGLPELADVHGGISRALCVVGTFPQLEYPRRWPPHVHVTGPLLWEPPSDDVELPPGDEPLVVVAPSTSQDPSQRLLRTALRGLAGLPIRMVAIHPRGKPLAAEAVGERTRLVDWLPYSRTLPRADVVVCHGGHGTLAHALASGAPVVTVPAAGDMTENGTRAQWAGVGLSLPGRLLTAATLRWTAQRVLEDRSFKSRVQGLADWARVARGPCRAAEVIEGFALTRAQAGRPTA
jgi:UDP:flavonoid glycosyltransferase YjiC (YdhE family)